MNKKKFILILYLLACISSTYVSSRVAGNISNSGKETSIKNRKRENIISMADVALRKKTDLKKDEKANKKEESLIQAPETEETKNVYLSKYLTPWKDVDYKEKVELTFEDSEIKEFLKFLENNLEIKFILDDDVKPGREGNKPLAATRITFRSNTPVTLKEAWDLCVTFLEMAGFSIVPGPLPRTYRVVDSAGPLYSANKDPLPTFIGTSADSLPNADIKIRYVYFIQNADIDTVLRIVDTMKSASAGAPIALPELKAIMLTDKSLSIKSLLNVISEIDTVTMPDTLAIIRLRYADADAVANLWLELIGKRDENASPFNPYKQKKAPTTQYFNESTRVIPEPRTNTLIVLGTRDNIKKFEEFILRYIDKSSDAPFSPLHVIQLKFIDAVSTAKILMETIQQFNSNESNKAAANYGGIRDGARFFKNTIKITPEPSGNKLVINSDYDEYLKILEIIEKLDVEQPQVAIKVLVLDVELTNLTQLGTQIRNSVNCCDNTGALDPIFGRQVNAQFAGLGGIVTNPVTSTTNTVGIGAQRLLGNLLNLAQPDPSTGISIFPSGSTLLSFGQDLYGYSALIMALEQFTRVTVIANPFLITTHKYPAEVKVGETRRVLSAVVQGQSSSSAFTNLDANLDIKVTPQISYDNMVKLDIMVSLGQFLDPNVDSDNANRLIKTTSTQVLAANREVIALGGLIRDEVSENIVKVPILGDIPLIGWFFKNKSQTVTRSSLLVLISPEIIAPNDLNTAEIFTYEKISDAKNNLYSMKEQVANKDPIHRWLFKDYKDKEVVTLDKFVANQDRYVEKTAEMGNNLVIAENKPVTDRKKRLLELVDRPPVQEVVA